MANTATRAETKAEAVREVFLGQDFIPSKVPQGYDGSRGLHKQFWTALAFNGTELLGGHADNEWRMDVWFAWEPQAQRNDPDRGQYEIASAIEDLIIALNANATLSLDDLRIEQADPEWARLSEEDETQGFWDVQVRVTFRAPRDLL